ncbi:MAG: ATP-binding cassette domain-containing protein, partial [Planctomycetia bacterium]
MTPHEPAPSAPGRTDRQLVEVSGLNRVFDSVHAVRDLCFTIPRGSVVGFIGANGAGKTTTMRIMATLDEPTSGSVRIAGHDVVEDPRPVRRLVGFMPDAYGTYPNMNVFEYLDFFARSYGFGRAERRARVEEVMHFADLGPLADDGQLAAHAERHRAQLETYAGLFAGEALPQRLAVFYAAHG